MQPSKNSKELDYEKLGVAPPTSESHGTEEDISKALNQSLKHSWRQAGARLFCVSCPWEHATEARLINYILMGTDNNGAPILKKIKSS